MNKKGKIMSRGQFAATVVILSMLLCACVPAITVWNQDFEATPTEEGYKGLEDDGKFTYVSLGDSMVNGFGTYQYYPEGYPNVHGLLNPVTNTYPDRINTYLQGIYGEGNVDWKQLGISATRSAELRYLIDDSFVGDYYSTKMIKDSNVVSIGALLPTGYDKTVEGLKQFYVDNITAADLITYQFHYDFGYTLTDCIMTTVNGGELNDMDFELYIDGEFIEMFNETYSEIKALVLEKLAEEDIVLDDQLVLFAENIAQGMAYSVVSYCANFDGNMAAIFGMNPDVRVVVIDSYNTLSDMDMIYGDYTVPLGGIYQILLDTANLYTKWLSPYSYLTYHVSIDGVEGLISDEFKNADIESPRIDNDAKNAIISVFAQYTGWEKTNDKDVSNAVIVDGSPVPCSVLYDSIDGTNHNLTKLLKTVFSTTDLDWNAFMDGNVNDKVGLSVKKLMTAVGYIDSGKEYASVECVNGTCTVSIPDPEVEPIVMDQYELAFAWMDLYLYEYSAVLSHPTPAKGHAVIYDAILDVIEERNVLTEDRTSCVDKINGIIDSVRDVIDGPYNPEYVMTLGMDNYSANTVVSLCDQSAYMDDSCYPAVLADMLGLDLDPMKLPAGLSPGDINLGLRVDDINYLLGGIESQDAYGKALGIDSYRKPVQDSVRNADVVILQAGTNNAMFPLIETISQKQYGETILPFDVTDLQVIDPEFYADVMDLISQIEDVAVQILGEDVKPTISVINTAIESTVYGLAGFIQNYPGVIASIYALNPDAEVVVLGINNFLDGFYVTLDDGTKVDLGIIGRHIAGAMNSALGYMVSEIPGINYVDITYAQSQAAAIGGIDLRAALETVEDPIDALKILPFCAPSEFGQKQIAAAIQDVFFDKTYTVTYNVKVGNETVSTETFEVNYGSEISDYIPDVPAGYRFIGWDAEIPETMPAKDLVFEAQVETTDVKLVVEIDEAGDIITTVIGLDGSFAPGTLQVSYVYGDVIEGIYETGTINCESLIVENKDGKTNESLTSSVDSSHGTIQSAWAVYTFANGTSIQTPHILYQYPEVSA